MFNASDAERGEFRQFSVEAFKYWSRCRRQFYYKHVRRLQWPSDQQHFSLGKDVHKLLDYHARGLDCEPLLACADVKVQTIWRKLMAHPVAHLPVLASEWAFHAPVRLDLGRVEWLTGRMDRVARDGDTVVIIDWKTGTGIPRNPEADWQTRLYLYALAETINMPSAGSLNPPVRPLPPESLRFLYLEARPDADSPVREIWIDYDSEKHDATQQVLIDMLSAIAEEEDYPLPENGVCPDRYCAYRTICGIEPHL